jgi:hypothetical protein
MTSEGGEWWKADDARIWTGGTCMLGCHSTSLGMAVFDHFEVRK